MPLILIETTTERKETSRISSKVLHIEITYFQNELYIQKVGY